MTNFNDISLPSEKVIMRIDHRYTVDRWELLNVSINIIYVALRIYTRFLLLYCAWRRFLELNAHSRIVAKPQPNILASGIFPTVTYIFE